MDNWISLENIHEIAEPLAGETVSGLLKLCLKHKIYVIGSIAERKQDEVYNTCVITGPEGIIGTYSKVHLFRLMNEHKYLQQGNSCEVFQTTFGKIASVICYDIRFPELIRKVALSEARILFVPAEWPYPRLHHWRYLLLARAIENQLFVVAANRVGADKNNTFFGHSMVIDPTGEVLVEAGDTETILTCELDLGLVNKTRNLIPCFKDRKPGVYR